MNQPQESLDNLSPRAAAFSINRLLTEDTRSEDSCPGPAAPLRDNLVPAMPGHRVLSMLPGQGRGDCSFVSNLPGSQRLQNSSTNHEGQSKDHTIRNILDKNDPHDHRRSKFVHSVHMDPLQQFAACCDIVRNLDTKNNTVYNEDSRFLHVHNEIQVALQHSELWWKFYACGTEMVITRTGRRMFPTLALSVLGMDPRKTYAIHMDIVPVDSYSYTFANNLWQVNGMASEMHPFPYLQSYQADEVARSGRYWMKNGVDVKKVRLTNRRTGSFKDGELHLSPNRKYQPRVHVVEETEEGVKVSCSTYVFPETTFIAVTTYQNEESTFQRHMLGEWLNELVFNPQLIQMKIDHNPFAKGFRDKGSRRRFVPYEHGAGKTESSMCSSIQGFSLACQTGHATRS